MSSKVMASTVLLAVFGLNIFLMQSLTGKQLRAIEPNESTQLVLHLKERISFLEQDRNALQEQTRVMQQNLDLQLSNRDHSESIGEIMKRTGTDKYSVHHYEQSYARWLEPFRFKSGIKFLEIGADKGYSLALWAEYFDDPELILGLAYGDPAEGVDEKVNMDGFVTKNHDKLRVLWGDQSRHDTMESLCKEGPWDVIVDDGSHVPAHILFSFVNLMPCLVPGGLYIVEDVETSYWDGRPHIYTYPIPGVGIGASPRHNVIEKFKQLIDVMNRHEICREDLSVIPHDGDICSMDFSANILRITKCTEQHAKERKDQCMGGTKKGLATEEMVREWAREAKSSNIDF